MLRQAEIEELEAWICGAIRADIGAGAPADNLELAKLAVALGYEVQLATGDFEGSHQAIRFGTRIVAARHRLPPMQAFGITKPIVMT